MTYLELLAPAKNADIGIEAIRHGADAVYIGAESFGARQAAGNSVEDIARLVGFAHQFQAKVYVTVNTIIYDDELNEVETLIQRLYDIGVDALIVQDMSIGNLNIPPIPLHASTQMDNRSAEKVKVLEELGYEQVVLARELSLDEIRSIHEQCPSTRLEVFVHGALCVSLSGRCYASQALTGRSANRGECAQICRMAFDLENERGDVLIRDKHFLSLKDMCRIDALEALAEAGATSFKIEGRLKDMGYVKNVTAAYSQALDRLVARYPERYSRSSYGKVSLKFKPDVEKSFNRGFTDYFLFGNNDDIFEFDTPKAIGKEVGRIKDVYTDSIVVETYNNKDTSFANGDGLCGFTPNGELIGFRINKADGRRLYLLKQNPKLRRGMRLYRNYDKQFEDVLSGNSAERHITVDMTLSHETDGFVLSLNDGQTEVSKRFGFAPELARTPQHENVYRQLSKLGNTPLFLNNLDIAYKKNYFLPSSLLSQWRREVVKLFFETVSQNKGVIAHKPSHIPSSTTWQELNKDQDIFRNYGEEGDTLTAGYQFNISNAKAEDFYERAGFTDIRPAFDLMKADSPLMTCRHCIRRALNICPKKNPQTSADYNTLFLKMQNGKRLRLHFDCKNCLMLVFMA